MGMAKRIAQADVINLGSTYARSDFNYSGLSVRGVNLANAPQYLDVDLKFVNKYKKWIGEGKKVVIALPNFVFAADALAMSRQNDIYYFKFSPRELEWFSVSGFLKAAIRRGLYMPRRLAGTALRRFGLRQNDMPPEKKQAAAYARIQAWQTLLGIPSMKDGDIPDVIRQRIKENIALLDEIIRGIKLAGGDPCIVVPPVSEIMNRQIDRECMQAYLLDPIEARADKSVPVLNFLYEAKYQPAELYWNADCLNRAGAGMFTRDVCTRLGLMDSENANEAE